MLPFPFSLEPTVIWHSPLPLHGNSFGNIISDLWVLNPWPVFSLRTQLLIGTLGIFSSFGFLDKYPLGFPHFSNSQFLLNLPFKNL